MSVNFQEDAGGKCLLVQLSGKPLIEFLRDRLVAERTIDPEDLSRLLVTDSPEQAVKSITETVIHRFGLTYGPRFRRRWFLWE